MRHPYTHESCPAYVRERVEHALSNRRDNPIEGDRVCEAMRIATAAGYDFPEPVFPVLDTLEAMRAAKDPKFIAFSRDHGLEIAAAQHARTVWQGQRRWAAAPPQSEIDAERLRRIEAEKRAAAIDARARELLAAEEQKRIELLRRKAEKEFAS